MVEMLGISKAQASEIKDLMEEGFIHRVLRRADEALNGHGVEYLNSRDDTSPVAYVNRGDTYDTTLMFDYEKGRFLVGSWGDLVERQPRRFAD
jgi:hypothetical protein